MDNTNDQDNLIAIIGMSGRFPGADSLETFWTNLISGKDSITRKISKNSGNRVLAGGVINNIEEFDAEFFNMTPQEALVTDPQHRLFLEICHEAFEKAGYIPQKYEGSIGVFATCGPLKYLQNNIENNKGDIKNSDFLINLGNQKDYISTKVSYKFNLRGPSMTIQTACSSSLVAVTTACTHLLTFQCDMALAGGMSISLPQEKGYLYQEGMIFSPDGYCRPFDDSGCGTVPSNGGGVVLLKRYEDAIADGDNICAVIRGYGINNDGFDKVSFSAPSIKGQANAVQMAFDMADINPETISYIEAHGTGTLLGDPIEIDALKKVFGNYTNKKQFCGIGSVKGNIGHLLESAGIVGLIKVVLSLQNRQIPKTVNFKKPNRNIDFEKSPFYVNESLKSWKSDYGILRAGISSFGMGGTNVHMILEENRHISTGKQILLPTYTYKRKRYWIDDIPSNAKPILEQKKSNMDKISIEKELAIIWKELLGEGYYHNTDDFFYQGGDSLMSLELAGYIDKKFHVDWKNSDVLKFPTFSQQADQILYLQNQSTASEKTTNDMFIKLKDGVGPHPLFIIHQIEGHILQYHNLVELIEYSGPIYGIQSIEARKEILPEDCTIEELASFYVDEINKMGFSPPYKFLGASLGGIIAYEMAFQMKKKSQKVDFLALIDSIAPDQESRNSKSEEEMTALLIELFEANHIDRREIKTLSKKHKIERLMKSLNLEILSYGEKKKIFNEICRNWSAFQKYKLKVTDEPIIFIEAKRKKFGVMKRSLKELWKEVAKNIKFYELDTDHLNILKNPKVQKVAEIINQNL